MGSAISTEDTIPVLVTLVDVHHARARDLYYFALIGSGGVQKKVVGRSQTLAVEVAMETVGDLEERIERGGDGLS